ncbi:glycosyltransferase [Microbacterium sp. B24]|uniref:glycosyltransferase n=1 Tax=Microbacterium sp. B24 TaxID=95616 RepID=UPI0035B50EE3
MIRSYLAESCNAQVEIVQLSSNPGYLRHCFEILVSAWRRGRRFDVVVLAEFSVPFAAVAWLISRFVRARFVVDFFVGLYETHVQDRAAVRPKSAKARVLRWFDAFALDRADLVLSDTEARAAKWSGGKRSCIVIPVGAPEWAQPTHPPAASRPLRILYYGNYIPLHGLPTVIRALEALDGVLDYRITLIGDGEARESVQHQVEAGRVATKATFLSAVPERELAGYVERSHVVLGVFGESEKASTVIANKVWQGLLSGRVVATRDGPGVDEIKSLAGEQLALSCDVTVESVASAVLQAAERVDRDYTENTIVLRSYVSSRLKNFGDWVREAAGAAESGSVHG